MIGLTGDYDSVKRACKSYRVYFSTPPSAQPTDDYLVDHRYVPVPYIVAGCVSLPQVLGTITEIMADKADTAASFSTSWTPSANSSTPLAKTPRHKRWLKRRKRLWASGKRREVISRLACPCDNAYRLFTSSERRGDPFDGITTSSIQRMHRSLPIPSCRTRLR